MADYYCENCEFFENRSTDKLIDGYCKKYNCPLNFYDWWEKCDNCVIETLQAENAALRERLENVVELPSIRKHFTKDGVVYELVYKDDLGFVHTKWCDRDDVAEARLAELKGGKE